MTEQQHPITPPPELVTKWLSDESSTLDSIAIRAAHWGADQELEACCEWMYENFKCGLEWAKDLRAARRPKPLGLKEMCLMHLSVMERDGHYIPEILDDLRRALESLPD